MEPISVIVGAVAMGIIAILPPLAQYVIIPVFHAILASQERREKYALSLKNKAQKLADKSGKITGRKLEIREVEVGGAKK